MPEIIFKATVSSDPEPDFAITLYTWDIFRDPVPSREKFPYLFKIACSLALSIASNSAFENSCSV